MINCQSKRAERGTRKFILLQTRVDDPKGKRLKAGIHGAFGLILLVLGGIHYDA